MLRCGTMTDARAIPPISVMHLRPTRLCRSRPSLAGRHLQLDAEFAHSIVVQSALTQFVGTQLVVKSGSVWAVAQVRALAGSTHPRTSSDSSSSFHLRHSKLNMFHFLRRNHEKRGLHRNKATTREDTKWRERRQPYLCSHMP